jgi:ferrous iron transport protein A
MLPESPITLDELAPGERATVRACRGDGAVFQRLSEIGLVPGACLRVVRLAPFGDPLEVQVGRFHLALRRTEARRVEVERLVVTNGAAGNGTAARGSAASRS